jgi:ankyrin repeat protein
MSDPEYHDYHGIQASSPVDALCLAAVASKFDVMDKLLADGVDINGIAGYSRQTSLGHSASQGMLRSVDYLLFHGADVNARGESGSTPLMLACHSGKVNGSKIALRLLEAGADVNLANGVVTALSNAVHDCPGCTPEFLQALIDRGAAVEGPPGAEITPLMMAAQCNNVDALKILVKNGADLHRPCLLPWAKRSTAAGLAVLGKQKKAAAYLASVREEQASAGNRHSAE